MTMPWNWLGKHAVLREMVTDLKSKRTLGEILGQQFKLIQGKLCDINVMSRNTK